MTIKALSVKQPFANLIAIGQKTIETRVWRTHYRGPLLIVSSRKPDVWPIGCALALVNLVDCRPMTRADEEAACCPVYPKAFAWELEDVRAFAPFPVKGALRLFDVKVRPSLLKPLDLATLQAPGLFS